jgi:hypothetical protein
VEVYVYKTGFQFVAETSRDFNVSRINPVTAVGDDRAKDMFTSKSSMVKVFDGEGLRCRCQNTAHGKSTRYFPTKDAARETHKSQLQDGVEAPNLRPVMMSNCRLKKIKE